LLLETELNGMINIFTDGKRLLKIINYCACPINGLNLVNMQMETLTLIKS